MHEVSGVRFSDEDRQLIERSGLKVEDVAAEVVRERERKAANEDRKLRAGGAVTLTGKDRVALKDLGIDPDEFLFCAGARNAGDHARLKQEYRAARGGVA